MTSWRGPEDADGDRRMGGGGAGFNQTALQPTELRGKLSNSLQIKPIN